MPVRPLGATRWALISKRLAQTDTTTLLTSRQPFHAALSVDQSNIVHTREQQSISSAALPLPLPSIEHINPGLQHEPTRHQDHFHQLLSAPENESTHSIKLPLTCPGCGAFSQQAVPEEAGHYTWSRKAVKGYLRTLENNEKIQTGLSLIEDRFDVEDIAVDVTDVENCHARPNPADEDVLSIPTDPKVPVCDRCHDLIYHHRGVSIAHPTLDALADSIAESPYGR